MDAQLTAEAIRFSYEDTPVLHGIDLALDKGSLTGIIGPNGSGKSTLIKLLAGVLRPDGGRVRYAGSDLASLRRRQIARRISVVPQEVIFHFPFRVFDFVMMGRHPYQKLTPFESEEDFRIVAWALEQTGIETLKHRSVLELSGGEKQRTVLASALAQEAPVMLLDEPTASLDLRYQVQIHKILRRLAREKELTVLLVTHDLNLGSLFCDRLVMMNQGRIVADGTPAQVCTEQIVREHYGVDVTAGVREGDGRPFILPTGK